jgi:hypothetical protein
MTALLLLALLSTVAHASGWNDYELPIDSAYSIYRMNADEICLGDSRGHLILCPHEGSSFGRIVEYAQTNTHIFTRNLGGGSNSQAYALFIVSKDSGSYVGPLDGAAFETAVAALGSPAIEWMTPRNPNVIVPMIGSLLFLAIALIWIGWPLYVPGWPLVVGVALLFWWRRHWRRRSNLALQRTGNAGR